MSLREKGQYALGFGVIALMLYVVGFPVFLLLFFAAIVVFVWKAFLSETRGETRRIFEFYLLANEVLRDDDRRWYGFEVKDTIARGEAIIKSMSTPPPLVHFGLGALYQKIEDHSSAVRHLAHAVEDSTSDEAAIMFPSKELRAYVTMLRKIERAPAESPVTSAAVRSLERARKNRGAKMLDQSREMLAGGLLALADKPIMEHLVDEAPGLEATESKEDNLSGENRTPKSKPAVPPDLFARVSTDGRKTISEVLHDIYDDKVQ